MPTRNWSAFGKCFRKLAGTTRLELATSAVTGQRSNQLNYVPSLFSTGLWETRMLTVFLCDQWSSPASTPSTEYIHFSLGVTLDGRLGDKPTVQHCLQAPSIRNTCHVLRELIITDDSRTVSPARKEARHAATSWPVAGESPNPHCEHRNRPVVNSFNGKRQQAGMIISFVSAAP